MEPIDLFKPKVVDNTLLKNKQNYKHLHRETRHKDHSCKYERISATACFICVVCCLYAVWTNENLRDLENRLKVSVEKCHTCVESRKDADVINGITKVTFT